MNLDKKITLNGQEYTVTRGADEWTKNTQAHRYRVAIVKDGEGGEVCRYRSRSSLYEALNGAIAKAGKLAK